MKPEWLELIYFGCFLVVLGLMIQFSFVTGMIVGGVILITIGFVKFLVAYMVND